MRVVRVELGERSYNVTIGSGLLAQLGKYVSAITRHRRCARREEAINSLKLLLGQLNINCIEILFEIFHPFCARNRHNLFALRQHPSQS